MKYFDYVFTMAVFLLLSACSSDGGSNTAPELPADPEGTKSFMFEPGKRISIDGTSGSVILNNEGCLEGENTFFSTAGKRIGLLYVTRIPTAPWNKSSDILQAGYGYVMGHRMDDGAMFSRIFVDDVDSLSGRVKIKSESPFYGDGDKFYFNHKTMYMYREAGDTTLVLIKPTTYNVELASGEWVRVEPHTTYVKLLFQENRSGKVRVDTLIFSNGRFKDATVPVVQFEYSPVLPLSSDDN